MGDVTDILVGVDKLLSEHGFCEMASARHQLSIAISLHKQRLKQAHREGWEQCKREAENKLVARYERYSNKMALDLLNEIECCALIVAAMGYKEH